MMDAQLREAATRDFAQYVGMQIKLARVARRMTLDDVAALSGISKTALSRLENGLTDAKLSTIAVLRSVLALDITVSPIH